jgi:hypothetical protein
LRLRVRFRVRELIARRHHDVLSCRDESVAAGADKVPWLPDMPCPRARRGGRLCQAASTDAATAPGTACVVSTSKS